MNLCTVCSRDQFFPHRGNLFSLHPFPHCFKFIYLKIFCYLIKSLLNLKSTPPFCFLLFIITRIICKSSRVCSYLEGRRISVDQMLSPISFSRPLDFAFISLYSSVLKLYITLRKFSQEGEREIKEGWEHSS